MSGGANQAVFLSYASQDAEAARRICEALRSGGVEVWFDADGGLEHGDEWDAKIRKQIKECVLFIPIISANTQARLEGYFRIEWELAAQRAMGIASGVPFILPVVIDETREPEALVPDRFRTVQWTRLPGGVVTPEVKARYLKLWSHRIGAAKHAELGGRGLPTPPSAYAQRDAAGSGDPALQPTVGRRMPVAGWIGAAAVAAAAAVAGFVALRPAPNAGATAEKAAPFSEARKLVAQARTLFDDGDQSNHENFFLADDLLKRAQALDPTDGEVWAAQAQLSGRVHFFGFDRTNARRETMRVQAERALKLSPGSFEARLAMAAYLTYGGGPTTAGEAIGQLNELAKEAPQNRRVFWTLGSAYSIAGKIDESAAAFRRGNQIPGGDPEGLALLSGQLFYHGRYAEVEDVVAQALAVRPVGRALLMDVQIKLSWRGDLDGAMQALARWPAWLALEDRGGFVASQAWLWRREPDKAIAVLNAMSRDFLTDSFFSGPKAGLLALAHEMAGRPQAARSEWERAREVTERALGADPSNRRVVAWKAITLAKLGQSADAEKLLHELEQLRELRSDFWSSGAHAALLRIALGRGREVPAKFDAGVRNSMIKTTVPSPRAALRLNPVFDPIRETPEFQQWLAAAPAPAAAEKSAAADKSLAVLAFDNRSDDKDAENFSDGMSDELIRVLGRVPGLTVKGSTSAFFFKGRNATAKEIGEKLGAAYLVRGSVQKSGGTVRITAQLTRAATDEVVWVSEPLKRELKEVWAVQEEIAGLIAQNLQLKLELAKARAAVSPEAYARLLNGRAEFRRESIEGWNRAIAFFRQAIALEANYAVAWGEIALSFTRLARFGGLPTSEGMREARAAALKALELDPEESVGWHALAWVQRTADWNWREAQKSYARALALAPGDAGILSAAAALNFNIGRVPEGITLARQAVERDPLRAATQFTLGSFLISVDPPDEGCDVLKRAVELAPAAEQYRHN